jgi:hypothetical protein
MVGITNGIMALTASMKNSTIVSSSTQIQNYDIFALNSNLYNSTGSLIGITNGIMALTASMKAAAIVSSSTQVQNYDLFALNSNLYTSTGSLIGITNGIMALTASMKNSTIVSSSNQIPELFTLMQATASINSKTGSYATTGSNIFIGTSTFSGSVYVSGSVYGNVTAQPVTSNTSSIDISTANFFTITLGSSVTTHISASNVRAGQSVNILVTTGTNSSASFSTNIKQISGSFYQPTSGSGNKDILSLVSFDTTSLYLVAVNQMI